MVKDTLNSVFENFKERTKNPFLGTLVVVWIVHNWRLVYSLFYFDSKLALDKRLSYIEQYFSEIPFYLNLLHVFLLTILILSVTYLFLGVSRFISDFYNKVVIAEIVGFIDKNAVVLRSKYLEQQEIIENLELKLETERLAKVTAQKERDTSDEKLSAFITKRLDNDESGTVQKQDNLNIDTAF